MKGRGEVSSCTAHITTTTRAHMCPIRPRIPCHLLHTRTHTPLFVQLTPSKHTHTQAIKAVLVRSASCELLQGCSNYILSARASMGNDWDNHIVVVVVEVVSVLVSIISLIDEKLIGICFHNWLIVPLNFQRKKSHTVSKKLFFALYDRKCYIWWFNRSIVNCQHFLKNAVPQS